MRQLILLAVVLAFAAPSAWGKKKKRRSRAPAYQAGQTCVLTKSIKLYTKSKKKLTLKRGVKLTLVKVGKQWVSVKSDKNVEGSVKLNKALAHACKASAAKASAKTTAEAPPPPEPAETEVADAEPPPPPPDVEDGGEMELPDESGTRTSAGIDIPVNKKPEKVKAFSALDVLGAEGARGFAVERRSRRQSTRDLLGWGAIGLGGAGVITCGVLIGVSTGKASELAEDIEIYNDREVRSSAAAADLEDRKGTVAALDAGAIAAGAVGLAAVGAGLFLLLGGDSDSTYASTWVAPDQSGVGVILGGSF